MSSSLISIVLPTYNVEDHIERCLLSIVNQSYINFEVIVVDDCGIDSSIKIASEYAAKDKRIKIIHHDENLGTYHARKTGTINAVGDYILYLDPDDELVENALDIMSDQIKNNPALDLLFFNSKYIPKHSFLSSKPSVPLGLFLDDIPRRILSESKLTYGTPGKLYSKRVLVEGYNDLSIPENVRLVYGEDILIFASALFNVHCAVGLNKELYLYYRNEGSITNARNSDVINYNIDQLDLVVLYLYKLENIKNVGSCIKVILNRIDLYRIGLKKELASSNKEYFNLMVSMFLKTYSWRVLVNIMIFILTFSIKKR